MSDPIITRASIQLPDDFKFGQLRPKQNEPAAAKPAAPLGPLAAFVGAFAGNGFNTIFRPNNPNSPPLPIPFPDSDNVLELNLTAETLSFSKSLGNVPNRGTVPQNDIELNGVPYVQQINDITIHGESTPIHFEPGLWMDVPATQVPPFNQPSVTRMASIPHGTTINAQGIFKLGNPGKPTIDPVDITPIVIATGQPVPPGTFPSQDANNKNTPRIPQDLDPFISRGTITQAMLTNPNSLLVGHISKQNIVKNDVIFISTSPDKPPLPPPGNNLFGGGTANIAFLLGAPQTTPPPNPNPQNANAVLMTAVFWIETVEEEIEIGLPYHVGGPPILLRATPSIAGQRVARFSVEAPYDLEFGRKIKLQFTQIQYTQTVLLNFKGLSWPHVSVNTLVPADRIEIGPHSSVWGKK
jgi:hypothetical protein